MNKRIKRTLLWVAVTAITAGLCGWLWWGNVTPQLTAYEVILVTLTKEES